MERDYAERRAGILRDLDGLRVDVDPDKKIGYLTLNRPPLNIVSYRGRAQIRAIIEAFDEDEDVGVVVIRGADGVFSSGGDVKKFPDIHRGMLHVLDVPGFEFILIHIGNTDADTAGCLLVGTGAVARPGDMSIQSSTEAYRRLYPMVIGPAQAGDLEIEYRDSDR